MKPDITKAQAIAALNDAFRRAGPNPDWVVTSGVDAEGPLFVACAISAVVSFNSFTADNDPYGEHDFGAFRVETARLFWKIDYYDASYENGSPDAADPAVTRRVLTIMLADEY